MDLNSLFARAEQAFGAGRLEDARRDLIAVSGQADHPAVFHLLALTEKRRGDLAAARRAFERASALDPRDAKIAGNFANLLADAGANAEALGRYDQALSLDPGFRDARYNRALLLQGLKRLEEALADLDILLAAGPAEARLHSARASVLFQLGRLDEAIDAYDSALEIEPRRLLALRGRARVAMERGDDDAPEFYRRALAQQPGDLELLLGLAESLEAAGHPDALELLTDAVDRNPDWVTGHEILARMRSEAGEHERFADHYRRSLALRPGDRALHYSHWQSLGRGNRHGEALQALRDARSTLPDEAAMRLMEAVFVSESGDPGTALSLLTELEAIEGFDFARGRISLRLGDAAQAAAAFERTIRRDPGNIAAWAHVDLAWRLTGDPRHEWLTAQPGLYGARQLDLDPDAIDRLAEVLRGLHRTRAHPIGQSLRGGTQTRGRLFTRREPEITRLRDSIEAAVADHFAGLPARDDSHPLLRYRDARVRTEGSWSVRLTSQGFHVNHIHPEGILSSACYISLPATLGGDTRDGWLELGRPPVELGLDLEPLAVIEPQPGRLALFPSYLFHGTRPFSEGERLTVAFDVVPA